MKLNNRASNLKLAMNVAEVPIDNMGAEFVISIFDLLNQKKGEVTIREILKLKNKIINKYVVEAQQQQQFIENVEDENDEKQKNENE